MFAWINGEGAQLKQHTPGRTNYITRLKGNAGNRPFPLNPNFVSEPILSEELRSEIHRRVVDRKQSVRAVSVDLGVDMRRVAAVVRLVELEKRWKQQVCMLSFSFYSVPALSAMSLVRWHGTMMRTTKKSISL
jgi:hypothetical protein